jgi:hypothetical protein
MNRADKSVRINIGSGMEVEEASKKSGSIDSTS